MKKSHLESLYKAEKASAHSYADRMNAQAEAALRSYNESCARYKAEQEAFEAQTRATLPDATDHDIIRLTIQAGYGPRIYNPPVSAMVRYIVHD